VLAPALGLDVFDRVAVTLPDVRVEGVALFVDGAGVPGLSLREGLLAEVLLPAGAGKRTRVDAGATLARDPLRGGRRQAVVRAVERDLFERHRLAADSRLEFEPTLQLGSVDEGAVPHQLERHAVIR